MRGGKTNQSLEHLRHSLAHLLAAAVLEKFPKGKMGIGPAIEKGFYYDFLLPRSLTPDDLKGFEKRIKEFVKEGLSFRGKKVAAAEAKKTFKDQPLKLELIKDFVREKKQLSVYKTLRPRSGQAGEAIFTDLCRGGHVKNTKEINPEAFALTSIAGAYWKGSEKNPQLQRVYGVAFKTKKELDHYLWQQEEAKKRDHRILGERLGIFTFAEEIGAGLPLWLPKGAVLRDQLETWARETEKAAGYERVVTPHITKKKLYEISGHVPYYTDDMYPPFKIEGEEYYLKPMNCPHHHMIYKSRLRSYRELPLRLAEYGQLYRFELSGVLHGLFRVRGFCQNDAHIYVAEKDVVREFVRVMDMHRFYYKALGIKNFKIKLGLRDPKNLRRKYHGNDAMWRKAEKLTKEGLKKSGVEFTEDVGGAAHYGPKGDVIVESVIGKEYAIGTVQIDLFMPDRFNLTFINEKGAQERPVIIHRAPLGSHERMIGFLLEHFAGEFPTWLAPIQVTVLPISDKQRSYCNKIFEELKKHGIRAEIQKIPYLLVVGEKEAKTNLVAVRKRGKGDLGAKKLSKFVEEITKEISERKT